MAKESSLNLESHFNITPSQEIPVVIQGMQGNRTVALMTWGLVPSWAGDRTTGRHPINARAESLHQKPMFSRLMTDRRCLIPASGFFEWKKIGNKKVPYYIHRRDDALFAFAGLFDIWTKEHTSLWSCTIITTNPNQVVAPLHDRMPAILRRDDESVWLEKKSLDQGTLARILSPYPAGELESYRISRLINDTSMDSPEIIARVGTESFIGGERI